MAEPTSRLLEDLIDALKKSTVGELGGPELDALEHKANALVSTVRSLRNMSSPVHRLPLEVLALIFSKLAELEATHSFVPELFVTPFSSLPSVSRVSRAWREAALEFPSLWATINTSDPHLATQNLIRSANASLDVFLSTWRGWAWQDSNVVHDRKIVDFLDALAERGDRIKQLHLIAAREENLRNSKLLETSLPSLVSLTISLDPNSRRGSWSSEDGVSRWAPSSILGGTTPHLRDLTLLRCPPFPNQLFVNMSRVFIAEHSGTIPLSQLLGMLRASPRLEVLGLVSIELSHDSLDKVGHEPILLEHISFLMLGRFLSNTDVTIGQFLDYLTIPHPTQVFLFCIRSRSDKTFSDIFPLHHTPQAEDIRVLRITAPANTRSRYRGHTLKHWRRPHFYSVISDKSSLQIDGVFQPSQVFLELPTALSLVHVQELWIGTQYHSEPSAAEWTRLFASLPSLETLVISNRPSFPIISALTPSEHGSSSRPLLLCPNLRTLRIFADGSLSVLRLSIFFATRDRLGARFSLFELLSNGKSNFAPDESPVGSEKALWPTALTLDLNALEEFVDKVDYSQVEVRRLWDLLDTPGLDYIHRLWQG